MKKFLFLLSTVAFATSSFAAETAKKEENYGEFGIKLFEKLDADNNKSITVEELKAYHQKWYNAMDKDKDKDVEVSEAEKSGKSEKVVDAVDKNNDNKITFEESFAIEQARFLEYDDNKDGKVSWDEYKANYVLAQNTQKDKQ